MDDVYCTGKTFSVLNELKCQSVPHTQHMTWNIYCKKYDFSEISIRVCFHNCLIMLIVFLWVFLCVKK